MRSAEHQRKLANGSVSGMGVSRQLEGGGPDGSDPAKLPRTPIGARSRQYRYRSTGPNGPAQPQLHGPDCLSSRQQAQARQVGVYRQHPPTAGAAAIGRVLNPIRMSSGFARQSRAFGRKRGCCDRSRHTFTRNAALPSARSGSPWQHCCHCTNPEGRLVIEDDMATSAAKSDSSEQRQSSMAYHQSSRSSEMLVTRYRHHCHQRCHSHHRARHYCCNWKRNHLLLRETQPSTVQ